MLSENFQYDKGVQQIFCIFSSLRFYNRFGGSHIWCITNGFPNVLIRRTNIIFLDGISFMPSMIQLNKYRLSTVLTYFSFSPSSASHYLLGKTLYFHNITDQMPGSPVEGLLAYICLRCCLYFCVLKVYFRLVYSISGVMFSFSYRLVICSVIFVE